MRKQARTQISTSIHPYIQTHEQRKQISKTNNHKQTLKTLSNNNTPYLEHVNQPMPIDRQNISCSVSLQSTLNANSTKTTQHRHNVTANLLVPLHCKNASGCIRRLAQLNNMHGATLHFAVSGSSKCIFRNRNPTHEHNDYPLP